MLTVAAPVGGISAYASSAKISFSDPSATVSRYEVSKSHASCSTP